jgi:hypothetical protein
LINKSYGDVFGFGGQMFVPMVKVRFGGGSEDDSFHDNDFGLSGFGGGCVFATSLGKEEGADNKASGNGWGCVAKLDCSGSTGFVLFSQQFGGHGFLPLWSRVDIVVCLE